MGRPFKAEAERVRTTRGLSVSMPIELVERIEGYAKRHKVARSKVVEAAVRAWLASDQHRATVA